MIKTLTFTKVTSILLVSIMLSLDAAQAVYAAGPQRIVVLPFYSEEGRDVKNGQETTNHYRRMMRFINNQLVRHNFEVINPFAKDASEREYNRVMQRAREDSPLAALTMCKKYATDAAYIVWLKVKVRKTADGYYKAAARLDGEGYDSAGHDLGAGMSKTFVVTRRDADDAIAEVEKEVGDLVGRKLTAWNGSAPASHRPVDHQPTKPAIATIPTRPAVQQPAQGGILAQSMRKYEQSITVRLDQAIDFNTAEVFGKVVNIAPGVVDAKLYGSQIIPNNPQGCYVNWRLLIDGTEPFRLQANIIKLINDIIHSGGTITINNVPFRYTPAEIDMLKGIRPGSTSSREIQFIVDRELARDREMAGRLDPYAAKRQQGFK